MDREKSFSVCNSLFRYQWGFDAEMYKMRHRSTMYNLENIKRQFALKSTDYYERSTVASANFSRNGDLLAAAYYLCGDVTIWDWKQNKLKTLLSTNDVNIFLSVNWMPASQDLVTCNDSGVIRLFDPHRNNISRQITTADWKPRFGKYYICVDYELPYQIFAPHSNGTLFVFDLRSNQASLAVTLVDKRNLFKITSCALNPSWPNEFCVGSLGKARIYDIRNLKESKASFTWPIDSAFPNISNDAFLEIKYSYNGRQILSSGVRKAVYMFEAPFENECSKFHLPNTQAHWSKVNFIGSRSEFIVVTTIDELNQSQILIWEKSNSKLLYRNICMKSKYCLQAVHPYSTSLALAMNQGGIEIWR